ncbi:MAG TPA: ABC transporter permease [Candidatus Limnocylindria bacterium]|nr:ABC transporter permease [Candidatus Limnocylindria bacterium]
MGASARAPPPNSGGTVRTFILRRLIYAIPTLVGISIITFVIVRLAPGDPIRLFTFGSRATSEDIEALRHLYGLDKPLPLQYVDWLMNILRLDFGQSFIYHQPAAALFLDYVWNTLQLALVALALQLLIGVPLGVIAALKRGTWIDSVIRVLSVAGHAVPTFWLGLVLIIFFAVQLRWLPTGGITTVGKDQWDILDRLRHMLLPAIVLSLTGIALYSRILRTETLDVLGQDYVRTAHAKGLRERTVMFVHALRNALIPVVTALGGILAGLVGGALVVETVFSWPGLGRFTFAAAIAKDYPVIQAGVMISSLLLVISYIIRDIVYAVVDPRISVR